MMVMDLHTAAFERAKADLAGASVAVVGLGKTGLSVARFLVGAGAVVTATDALPAAEIKGATELEELGIEVTPQGYGKGTLGESGLVVVSPGVPLATPVLTDAAAAGNEIISDIELLSRYIDAPIVAVTGTNGKSTTTELISRVLSLTAEDVFVGGNIGTPAIEYLDGADDMWCLLEVSSYQLEAISAFRPHVAVMLNISEDHLDRYDSFTDYGAAKARLFMNQGAEDYAVINVGDKGVEEALKGRRLDSRVVPFTSSGELDEGVFLKGDDVVVRLGGAEKVVPLGGFKLTGLSNAENIMAALAVAHLAGVSIDNAAATMGGFRGLPHRMELVGKVGGVKYVNDSKGTNVGALAGALQGMKEGVILIAGGVDKGGDYAPLAPLIKEKVKAMVLIGEAAGKMEKALGSYTDTRRAVSLDEAVRTAASVAAAGDTVLLCPACSSFDMFTDFKERGEAFRSAVKALRDKE